MGDNKEIGAGIILIGQGIAQIQNQNAEMLAALKAALAAWDAVPHDEEIPDELNDELGLWTQVRAAISKAEDDAA